MGAKPKLHWALLWRPLTLSTVRLDKLLVADVRGPSNTGAAWRKEPFSSLSAALNNSRQPPRIRGPGARPSTPTTPYSDICVTHASDDDIDAAEDAYLSAINELIEEYVTRASVAASSSSDDSAPHAPAPRQMMREALEGPSNGSAIANPPPPFVLAAFRPPNPAISQVVSPRNSPPASRLYSPLPGGIFCPTPRLVPSGWRSTAERQLAFEADFPMGIVPRRLRVDR